MKRREFTKATLSSFAAVGTATLLASNAHGASAQGQGAKFEEGVDYISLDKRVPADVGAGKIEVIEFFWYSCPHCNAFEPRFEAWIKSAPKDLVIKRAPVRFRDDFEAQQRMYYALEALNKVDALHAQVFKAIHVDRLNMTTADNLATWASTHAIDKAKFLEVFNSFGVATQAKRATQLQDAFKVQGVPALGVAGRFYTDGSLAGSMERAVQVVEYLASEVRKGR
jgi:thiol:disulfide interchange protein DsbA